MSERAPERIDPSLYAGAGRVRAPCDAARCVCGHMSQRHQVSAPHACVLDCECVRFVAKR